MLCTFAGMISITSNPKLSNPITSWKLIKMSQNFEESSLSLRETNKNMP